MAKQIGRRIFSLNYLFASFFGALMIASAFAYYNYKFAEYKFIDFEENIFYEKSDIFTPKFEKYIVVIFSSKATTKEQLLQSIKPIYPILAIDIFQKRFEGDEGVSYITAPINTLLKFIQRFNIYEVPSVFVLQRHNAKLYKQDSPIEKLQILKEG
jgi:hypothetical protein